MEFEWDPAKAEANLHKHGVSFRAARAVFDDHGLIEEPDDLVGYGEERWKAVGLMGLNLIAVIFTMRGHTVRIISARRATKDEQREYHRQQTRS
jgi:uncharacterized protein